MLNPIIATALQRAGGSTYVAVYLTALCLASFGAALLLPARARPATATTAPPVAGHP